MDSVVGLMVHSVVGFVAGLFLELGVGLVFEVVDGLEGCVDWVLELLAVDESSIDAFEDITPIDSDVA